MYRSLIACKADEAQALDREVRSLESVMAG